MGDAGCRWIVVFACALACSSPPVLKDTGPDQPPPQDAGSGSAADAAGTLRTDAERLGACAAPQPCSAASAQLIENSSHNIAPTTNCVLSALAARTPGRYEYVTDSTFGNGAVGAHHTLLVTEAGSVSYARVPYANIFTPGVEAEPPEPDPGQRCGLKPASYFETCAAAVGASTGDAALAWECAFGSGDATTPSRLSWFEACVTESPLRCE